MLRVYGIAWVFFFFFFFFTNLKVFSVSVPSMSTLRKHAYSNILKILPPKK